ncbi:MAG: peptidase U32 family protein, partial [Bacteroidota bacterium]|nr:peptidase U32 family protein [Bacteroidota bacterium]
MTQLELLAPAKDFETGKAAIDSGADAVYIGAPRFGARAAAGNSVESIKELIKYAHFFGAKVHLTLNTILNDHELDDARNTIVELYEAGVDAVIIQDMALLEMDLPPVAIHASTQTNNQTPEKVAFLEAVGMDRVILARELTLDEIKEIKSKTSVDLEFFVHGALCVSYSGQCYLSQALVGRSANRGTCSQPCRSAYNLIDNNDETLYRDKQLLSLKDLNLSKRLGDLAEAGITSFKIEGRLKDIIYVKNVVAFYRKELDRVIESNDEYQKASSGISKCSFVPDPDRSFNRGSMEHFVDGRTKNMSSFYTQKSIGKFLGTVISCDAKNVNI